MPTLESWYGNGLRFSCTRCGDCCRTKGDRRLVFLEAADIQRLAARFGLSNAELLHRHTESHEAIARVLKWPADACVFLGANGCTVYEDRPRQCRAWPFWPEHLETRGAWETEVVATCPGAGEGRLYSFEELRRIAHGEKASGTG